MLAGRHAQAVFRNEARVIELADNLCRRSKHPQLLLWVAWLVIKADEKITDNEALLMRHLVRGMRDRHEIVDEEIANLVDIDAGEVWRRIAAQPGDVTDVVEMADAVAAVDGPANKRAKEVLSELQKQCGRKLSLSK